MNGSNSRKIKLLKIWDILTQHTDESHPMSTPVLIQKLAEYGIEVSYYEEIILQDYNVKGNNAD